MNGVVVRGAWLHGGAVVCGLRLRESVFELNCDIWINLPPRRFALGLRFSLLLATTTSIGGF